MYRFLLLITVALAGCAPGNPATVYTEMEVAAAPCNQQAERHSITERQAVSCKFEQFKPMLERINYPYPDLVQEWENNYLLIAASVDNGTIPRAQAVDMFKRATNNFFAQSAGRNQAGAAALDNISDQMGAFSNSMRPYPAPLLRY